MFASLGRFFARLLGRETQVALPVLRRQTGLEPGDENRVDVHPTREQVDMVVMAHRAWVGALGRAGRATLGVEQCRTLEQATELYARAWLESALSVLAAGTGTGVAAYVMESLVHRGFRREDIAARIKEHVMQREPGAQLADAGDNA